MGDVATKDGQLAWMFERVGAAPMVVALRALLDLARLLDLTEAVDGPR